MARSPLAADRAIAQASDRSDAECASRAISSAADRIPARADRSSASAASFGASSWGGMENHGGMAAM
jgi:hypothetical protein